MRKLPGKKIAEIDPEEFYDFTEVRPQTRVNRRGERVIKWPRNDFYYSTPDDPERGLLLYIGTEPNLRWRPTPTSSPASPPAIRSSSSSLLVRCLTPFPIPASPVLRAALAPLS